MRILFGVIAIAIIVTCAWAGTTGKLVGKVVDAKTKEPLIGVNVVIVGTSPTLGASTDLDGNFTILNIRPGSYTVRVSYIGYQTVSATDVKISIDQTTTQNFELSSSSVELEEVVVVAQRDVIKKDITSSQSTVSSEQIESLPVAELDGVLQLQAGVTKDAGGGFHIRGGRTSEISYWVNGISITDSYDNSRGIQIDNNSIQELQVISGTFNAEFGNAMSGIVNTVTKEGGDEYHGSITVYGGDHLSTFTDYFPHIDRFNAIANKNVQASLSGSVPYTNNAVKFFANGRYYYDDGYLLGERRYTVNGMPGDGKIVSMNWRKNMYGQTNISFVPAQGLKVNLEGLYSKEDFQDYNHEYRWNPDGNVNKFSESGNATATFTHMLSPTTFYTVKGSFFFKDFNEYLYKNPFDSHYLHPDSLILPTSYAFRTKGTNLHRFYRETNTLLGKVDFTSQISDSHLLKLGAEVKTHELNFDDYTLQPLQINNIPVEPFQPSAPSETQPNREKYHNEPFEASAYLQDKIEYESVIINIGLRLDYFNSNGKVLVDPTDPNIYEPLRPGLDSLSIAEREPYFYNKAGSKFQISPRFGIAYPISNDGVVHFSYGHFLQIPPFQYLFNKGPYKVPHTALNLGVFGNPDLEPQKTVMYEIGFRQEFSAGFVADFTAFYRDVRNWVTAAPVVVTRSQATYSTYKNQDYANVKGATLTLNRRFGDFVNLDINYTYQVAEGTNSKPDDAFNSQKGGGEPSLYLIPMDWDQNHLLNAALSYGNDGWAASLLARFGTGLPYTPEITQYVAERLGSSGLLTNSRRIPSQFTLDLRLEKTLQLPGVELTVFTRIFNLLDSKIPVRVFGDTGKADFTTRAEQIGEDANRPNTVEEYLRYPDHYGEPRNVQFGMSFSF